MGFLKIKIFIKSGPTAEQESIRKKLIAIQHVHTSSTRNKPTNTTPKWGALAKLMSALQ